MGSKNGGKDARVIKPAGKPAFIAKTLSGQPTMHGSEGEFTLGKLAGNELARGGRAEMDGNRRP
jgi:hypothetical protein